MLLLRTERTHVAGRLMDETMTDHLVLPLETLPPHTARTVLDRAIVRATRGMHVGVRGEEILGLEGGGRAAGIDTFEKGGRKGSIGGW